MKKLSALQYEKAKNFMKNYAQDIDLAMFEYLFEDKPIDDVIKILETYQNDDGGFGKLDYDIGYPYSCIKHTESACRYIFALDKVPAEHPMIKKMINYILINYNEITGEWNNLTVAEINDYPHAPWWGYSEPEIFVPKNRKEMIEHFDSNTNAAIAGILVKYNSLVPNELYKKITDVVIEKINSGHEFYQYELMSNIYFANAFNGENRLKLLEKLMGNGKLISVLDGNWGTENAYKLTLWINSPKHEYYELYKDAVIKNIDFLVDSMENNGGWSPDWSWGEPIVWEKVKLKIKGHLTFEFLLMLKNFDCIEY